VIVRTWNLFHGNTYPPGRRAYLREMVELITADRPEIVCLQEIPAWALPHVGAWANMQSVWARARRPRLGPFPVPAVVGRALTAPHHGLTRSGFAGQGNVILFPSDASIREDKSITLNTNPFCEEEGRRLGLDNAWALQAVHAVGHYGEMFERNVGKTSPLKLERGLNATWTKGGLMYAIPFK